MADYMAGFFGSRGQGKSTQVHYLIWSTAPARLTIFDPMNEYREARPYSSLVKLGKAMQASTFAVRYVPPTGNPKDTIARFDAFCALAFHCGDLTMICEELQLVTRPSWAPPAWANCTLRGRHRQLAIVGVAQRPAGVDKNFLGNCNSLSTTRLNWKDDIALVASIMARTPAEVAALERFAYIARNCDTGQVMNGTTADLLKQMGRAYKGKIEK